MMLRADTTASQKKSPTPKGTAFWPFLRAAALLVATSIGVGIFGLPYVGAQAGFGVLVGYLVVFGAFVMLIQLMYGEVVLRTRDKHQFPGYAERYLGLRGKYFIFLSSITSLYGTLLAYFIIGGQFLGELLKPTFGDIGIGANVLFFAAGSVVILLGTKVVTRTDLVVSVILLTVIVLFFFLGAEHISQENLGAHQSGAFFLPYGAVLFALWGLKIIPELQVPLAQRENLTKPTIITSTIVIVAIYILFSFLVISIAGGGTSDDAISSLSPYLGSTVIQIGYLFGLLATFTSFLSIGITVRKSYQYDFHLSPLTSWLLTITIPVILYLIGLTNFIQVITGTGALILGIEGFSVIQMYRAAKRPSEREPGYRLNLPNWVLAVLTAVLVIGLLGTLLD